LRREDGRSAAVRWANGLFLAAAAISFVQAILQYKPWQRYLLSFGMDFWGECLLLAAFAIWIGWTRLPYRLTPAQDSDRAVRGSGEGSTGAYLDDARVSKAMR